jgi:hypothetical protein
VTGGWGPLEVPSWLVYLRRPSLPLSCSFHLPSHPAFPEQIGAVESVKAASDIYSPVAGNVTAVNDKLSSEANLLNKSPEKDGE